MASTRAAAEIAAHLHAERDSLRSFIALLETEQKDLGSGQTEHLLELSDKKTLAAQELNRMEAERKEKLRMHGIPGDMQEWADAQEPALRESWNGIIQLAAHARELNRTNGIMIHTYLRHNQQALGTLFKAANNTAGNSLYGPDGQTRISPSGRTLGSV